MKKKFIAAMLLVCFIARLDGADHLVVNPGNPFAATIYGTIQEAINNCSSGTASNPSTITIKKGISSKTESGLMFYGGARRLGG